MAIGTNISNFISTIGQGVKPNMFLVDIQWPAKDLGNGTLNVDDKDLVNLLCKSAALPASNLGVIEVPFRGRTVKIAGDRTFDTWTATFFNDKEMKARAYFEEWLAAMNTHEGNNAPLYIPNQPDGYMCDVKVKQLEKNSSTNGNILREYTLMHAFPTNVSQIDLAYDSNDQIEEFTVEFQYSYWKVLQPSSTDGTSNLDSGASAVSGASRTIEK
jgi:hypothetical protein